jgi:two-component system OmpR family sensor kinase
MTSIRRQLLVYLLAGILLAGSLGGLLTYRVVLRESDEILDYHLRQVALSLGNQRFGEDLTALGEGGEARFDLVVQVWDETGSRLYLSRPHTDLPGFAQFGFTSLTTEEGRWRVFSTQIRGQIIQVAQPMAVREGLAAGMALRVLLPFLVLIPVLGLFVWLAIGRALGPLAAVTRAVSRRNPDSLNAVELPSVPDELQPLVTALNALLTRLGDALDQQRAFTADAAHELRTPLAALQLQVQMIERSRDDGERDQAVARLKGGLQRTTHVVEQLLTLARQEGGAPTGTFSPLDLRALAVGVVTELAPLAQDKGIDLGMVGEELPAIVNGDEGALYILLANLVGNALRYTPEGGRVDVMVAQWAANEGRSGVCLEVTDNGPGIPLAERQRVFDRFYRSEGVEGGGSGLGLAIVQRIVQRHGGKAVLLDGPEGGGLRVRLEFPAAGLSQT